MNYQDKTREQLVAEIEQLKQAHAASETDYKNKINQIEFNLGERLKELHCHNQLTELLNQADLSVGEICEGIVSILPPGMQYPEIAQASVFIHGKNYQTPGFTDSIYKLSQPISVNQEIIGRVEVCYPYSSLQDTTNTFLPEESALLFSIAVRIGIIIEKEEKQLELIESQNKYRSLIENIDEVIYEVNDAGTINYISPAIGRILGYTAEFLTGKKLFDLVADEDRQIMYQRICSPKKAQKATHDYRFLSQSGEIRWMRKSTREFIRQGESILRIGTLTDISQQKTTEIELLESQTRYKTFFDDNYSMMLLISPETGEIRDANRAACKYYGWNHAELCGMNISEINMLPKEELALKLEKAQNEKNNRFLFRHRLASGEIRDVEVYSGPLKFGKMTLVYSVIHDITERNQAEEEKKRKDNEIKRLSQAIEQSPILMVVTDLHGFIEYVNPAFMKITGYSKEEVIGKNPGMLKSGKTDKAVYEDLWKTITAGSEWQGEWINRKKNGELYWESVLIFPVYDESGKTTSYLALKQDITQSKIAEQEVFDLNATLEQKIHQRTQQLEESNKDLQKVIEERKILHEALSASEQSYRTVVENVNEVIFQTDSAGLWIFLNKSWAEITGFSVAESLGKSFINYVHPDDRARNWELFEPLINRKKEYCRHQIRYLTKNGGFRWIEVYARLGVNEEDEITGTYGTLTDITERKRAEEFEYELLNLTPKLAVRTLSEINLAIQVALQRIGQLLEADRAYIFEFKKEDGTMSNTFEWCNEGISAEIENLKDIPIEVFPSWMEVLDKHENIIIPSVKDLPESWGAEREALEPQGIQSLIVLPMLVENELIGFVGLDSVKVQKEYSSAEINILTVWGSMLSSLLKNQRAEIILGNTLQNYQTFFNTIDDFLWVLDMQGNMISVNNTVKNRLEYSVEELLDKSVLMVHPPERREEAGRIVGEMLQGVTEYCPVPIVTKSGRHIPVETRVKEGFWDGKPVIFGVSKDISKVKLSEEKFSKAFQSNAALMAISGYESGIFMDVNETFLKTLGFTRIEVIGKSSAQLGLFPNTEIRPQTFEKVRQKIPVRDLELEVRRKDGSTMIGLFSAESIFVGDELCLLTLLVDISERKKAEEDLRRARYEADKANLAKSEFLSRMSHELRTPMNSILGFAQLLEMGDLLPGQKKGISHIIRSGRHLLDLINEVLDISRIEAGHLSLSLEPVQLNSIIDEMMEIVRPQAVERNLTLNLVSSFETMLFVKSDRQRLKQILLNLINNAVKYNKEGGSVVIKTEKMPYDSVRQYTPVRISITDTGQGISPEHLPKLFSPFERLGAEKSATEGTGLGLAVVKKLIDALDGRIGAESNPGEGSTFWIEVPHSVSQIEKAEKSGQLAEIASNLADQTATILYIEDNFSNVELVEQILSIQRHNIRVITNAYGRQAVSLSITHNPSLILLDLNLPDMHGSEVLKLLLEDERTKNIPVVIVSADAMQLQLDKLLAAGARKYLTKPLNVSELLKVIDEFTLVK